MQSKKADVRIVVLIAIVAIIYFGFIYTGSLIDDARSCNAGSWHVSSYDLAKGQMTISYGGGGSSRGCVGTYDVSSADRGGMSIPNQADCEYLKLSWDNNSKTCIIADGWFTDKTILSQSGSCTNKCIDARGCFVAKDLILANGESYTNTFTPLFDGYKVWNSGSGDAWISQSCGGMTVIGFQSNAPAASPAVDNPTANNNPSAPINPAVNNSPSQIDNSNILTKFWNWLKSIFGL